MYLFDTRRTDGRLVRVGCSVTHAGATAKASSARQYSYLVHSRSHEKLLAAVVSCDLLISNNRGRTNWWRQNYSPFYMFMRLLITFAP